jgi:hypothetical protein
MKAREFISTKLTIFLSVAALAVFAAACGTSQIASSGDKNVSEVLAGKQTETNDTNRDFRA